jgi:hypothetical protein
LKNSESIEDFLEGFPSVTRSQAIAIVEASQLKLLDTVGCAEPAKEVSMDGSDQ